MNFNNISLGELCSKVTSGGTPDSKNGDYYSPAEIPWLTTKEVNNCFVERTERYISSEGLINSSAKIIPVNSVIVAMYGQGNTAGRVAVNKIPLATNQACCNLIVDGNKADYKYIYYYLLNSYDALVSLKNGGAQPNLNAKKIKEFRIKTPCLSEQKSIARVLSNYDELIENNRRQIKLLEEAAQRLYKEWFVDLRFPGNEQTPITNGVPQGWRPVLVRDACSVLKRGISPMYDERANLTVLNQKCIRTSIVSLEEARQQRKAYPAELNVQDADTLICSTGTGTLGRVGCVHGELHNTTIDSHVTLVRADEGLTNKHYLYHFLKSQQPYLMQCGKGSTNQQELYKDVVGQLKMLLPGAGLLQSFENLAADFHHEITLLNTSLKLLAEARDRLLPKLMSGEIEVQALS